jgi:hypothetical protein
MTTIEAARELRDQFRAGGDPAPWSECVRIAALCRIEADAKKEADRLAFFASRKEDLRGVRFRASLRKAGRALEGARAIEGRPGMGIEHCPKVFRDPNNIRIAS